MPIERRGRSVSVESSIASTLQCSPSHGNVSEEENIEEWEAAQCPICLEPPHNAVLLVCSTLKCRIFMCDTSLQHSNCLDAFCNSTLIVSSMTQQARTSSRPEATIAAELHEENHAKPKMTCPGCRGDVTGFVVIESARRYMDSKVRSCSSEACQFSGTYAELQKHAEELHPSTRPRQVDSNLLAAWRRVVRQANNDDMIYTYIHERSLPPNEEEWRNVFFRIRASVQGAAVGPIQQIKCQVCEIIGRVLRWCLWSMDRRTHSGQPDSGIIAKLLFNSKVLPNILWRPIFGFGLRPQENLKYYFVNIYC